MTGQPAFTFRDTDATPVCTNCKDAMSFVETQDGPYNERDVYRCDACDVTFTDRWTF